MSELIPLPEAAQEGAPPEDVAAGAGDDLEAVRELVLRAHPDIVPELIGGDSVAAILASVEPARAAYARLSERLDAASRETPVPAGGGTPLPADPELVPPAEKIRRGLAASARRRS